MLTVPDISGGWKEIHDIVRHHVSESVIIQTVFTKPDTILLLHVQTNITQVKYVCVLRTVSIDLI